MKGYKIFQSEIITKYICTCCENKLTKFLHLQNQTILKKMEIFHQIFQYTLSNLYDFIEFILLRGLFKKYDFCHNFFLDVTFHYYLVHICGQQILLILNKNFQIFQYNLENNQQCVSVKWIHGARFDCVVYGI